MAYTLIGSDSMVADGGVNTNLQSHTPSGTNALASNWVHLQVSKPTASIVVEAADNTACQPYVVGANFYNAYVIGPTAAAIQKTQFTITNTTNATNSALILLAANATTLWNGYLAFFDNGSAAFKINRVDSGTLTVIGTPASGSLANNDVLSFEVDGSGNFTLRKNGTSVATATDATYTSGQPGIALHEIFSSGGINAYSAYQQAATTTYTLAGPTSGIVGTPSSNFTVTPSAALSGSDSITLSDGGGGGTFTPSSLSFSSGATAAQTFTYTPASAGAKSISATSATLGLTVSGSPISFTASAASSVVFRRTLSALGTRTGSRQAVA